MNKIMTKEELLKKNAQIKENREKNKAPAQVAAEPVCDECAIVETKKKRNGKKPSFREYMVVEDIESQATEQDNSESAGVVIDADKKEEE